MYRFNGPVFGLNSSVTVLKLIVIFWSNFVEKLLFKHLTITHRHLKPTKIPSTIITKRLKGVRVKKTGVVPF